MRPSRYLLHVFIIVCKVYKESYIEKKMQLHFTVFCLTLCILMDSSIQIAYIFRGPCTSVPEDCLF